ncbi:hypothetical protein C9374_009730 [Naegleria lovaniensis]|uniref:Uncharacterized protein n=1 Tax=Naegleria lovaniensis TaxID=51637 RepID=A0AA88GY29_NAELO|nr:uncharacterized protein C9374_009730 [Naegleria lovaniensis]KAG2393153.1 hypothetical protein C9374_009730 [Naegleria lovaniensis]
MSQTARSLPPTLVSSTSTASNNHQKASSGFLNHHHHGNNNTTNTGSNLLLDRDRIMLPEHYPTKPQHYQKGLSVRTPAAVAHFPKQRPQSSDHLSGRLSPYMLHKKSHHGRANEERSISPSPAVLREQLNKYKENTSPIIRKQFENMKNRSIIGEIEHSFKDDVTESSFRTGNSSFYDDKKGLPILRNNIHRRQKGTISPTSARERGFGSFDDDFEQDFIETPRLHFHHNKQKSNMNGSVTDFDDKTSVKILVVNDASRYATKYQPKSHMLQEILDQTDIDIPMADKITKSEFDRLEKRVNEELAHLAPGMLPGQLKKLKKRRINDLLKTRQLKAERMMQGLGRIDKLLQDYEGAQNLNNEVEFLSVDEISDLVFKEQVDRLGVINQSRDRIADITKDLDQRQNNRANILKGVMAWIKSYDEEAENLTEDKEEVMEIEGMLDVKNESVLEPLVDVQESIVTTLDRLKTIFEEYKNMRFSLLDCNAETFKDEEKRKQFLKKITAKFKKIETDIGASISELDDASSSVNTLKSRVHDKEKLIENLVERDKRHADFHDRLKDRFYEQQNLLKAIISRLKSPDVCKLIDLKYILTGKSDGEFDLEEFEKNMGMTLPEDTYLDGYDLSNIPTNITKPSSYSEVEQNSSSIKKPKKKKEEYESESEEDEPRGKPKKNTKHSLEKLSDDESETSSLAFDDIENMSDEEFHDPEHKRTDISPVWIMDNFYNYEVDKSELGFFPTTIDLEKFTPTELRLYLTAETLFKTVKRLENDRMKNQDFDAYELQKLMDMEEQHFVKIEDQNQQINMSNDIIQKMTEEIRKLRNMLVEKGVNSEELENKELGKTLNEFNVITKANQEKQSHFDENPKRLQAGRKPTSETDRRHELLEQRNMDNERRKWLIEKEKAESEILKLNTELKRLRLAKSKFTKGDSTNGADGGEETTGMKDEDGDHFDVSSISLYKGYTEEFKPTSEILREIEEVNDVDELKYIINIILVEADKLIDYVYFSHKRLRKFLTFLNYFTNQKGPNNAKYSEEEFMNDWIGLNKKIDKELKSKKKNGAESQTESPSGSPISPKRKNGGVSYREAVREQLNFLIEEADDETKTKRNPSRLIRSMVALMMKLYNAMKQMRYKAKIKTNDLQENPSYSVQKKEKTYKPQAPSVPKPPKETPKLTLTKVSTMTRMLKHQEEAKKRWEEKKMRILQEELAKGQMFYNVKTGTSIPSAPDLLLPVMANDGKTPRNISIPGVPML